MRRTPLLILAGVLALIGLGAVGIFVSNLPTTMSIAVGPSNSENHRMIVVLQQLLQRERADVRLRILTTDGSAASAALLQSNGAQLAIVRSDVDYPSDGLVIANLRREMMVVMVPAGSPVEHLGDLRQKRVGVVFAQGANLPLLQRMLSHYDIRPAEVNIFGLTPDEAGAALRDGRVDAIFTVGNPAGRSLVEFVARVSETLGQPPKFLPITQAEAIAQRSPIVEAVEIVRGTFGGAPPRPAEAVQTLGIVHRFVAHRSANEATVATLTQMIFALRPAIAAELPIASQMEAPDTDRGAVVPVHPGAIQYIEGNIKTFLDRYGDWFYIIVMLVGIVGSAIAGVASFAQNQTASRKMTDLSDLVALMNEARQAQDRARLDDVEGRVDVLFAQTLERISAGQLDSAQIAAFTLAFDQVRRAIADRRLDLPRGSLGRLAAAE